MKIGLTHTGNPEKHQYYVSWLASEEGIEIIRLSLQDNNLDELQSCDGLVLSGGVDIHPRFYGSDVTEYPGMPKAFNPERDAFETQAFHLSQENKIPVLGICRGMQLINVIQGGTLLQHLGEDPLNKIHEGKPDKAHLILIRQQTMMHDIIGGASTSVNSAHHQVIDKLGEGLVINAVSEDGFAEGIERSEQTAGPFLLAIQWHPERMFRFNLENSAASKSIRERFIMEIKKQKLKNEDH